MKTLAVAQPILRGVKGVWLGTIIVVTSAYPLSARQGTPPLSFQGIVRPLKAMPQFALPATDVQAELAADAKTAVATPLRFAVARKVLITPATDGTWDEVTNGRLWRLRITSPGAVSLNLGFTRFWLPEGATLHLISAGQSYYQGPYTSEDDKPHGQLWTPILPGDSLTLELFVPAHAPEQPQLVLSQVGAGYRDLFQKQSSQPLPPAEGRCNLDVVCPQAAAWTNEIRSVGLYSIGGTFTCTGTLLADTAGDFRSYFLTANHCGLNSGNTPTVVVYWNYQSTNCGTHGPGSLAQNQSGATFRASRYDVDFALIELDAMPDSGFGVYYSGWDRSGIAPSGGVGIHHPDADVKAISFSSNSLTTVNSCIGTGGIGTHWQVVWSAGITEPGSSGSGIWDSATHLLVGTLSGGGSACAAPLSPDCYGKFSVAWMGGTSAAERLQDWLDPQNTDVSSVTGLDPASVSIIADAGATLISESCSPTNGAIDPGETVTVSFALKNLGGVNTTNLVATLLPLGGIVSPGAAQNYGALLGKGSSVSQPFTFTATGVCGGTITPTFQLADGLKDLGTVTFTLALGAVTQAVTFAESFDSLVAPALPLGWISSVTGSGNAWATSTAQADTTPNAVFAADPGTVTDNRLVSPPMSINHLNAQLSFRHRYDLESGYDGGALEISINGGAFTDILDAGGFFATNGYNGSLSAYYQNPLAGRQAWSGNSGGFVTTVVNLPSAAVGGTVQLRWRLGSDNSAGAGGWFVDTLSLTQPSYLCCSCLVPPLMMNPRLVAPFGIAFFFYTVTGQTYFIETTTNLASPMEWTAMQTNSGDGLSISYTNTAPEAGQCFFRVRTQ